MPAAAAALQLCTAHRQALLCQRTQRLRLCLAVCNGNVLPRQAREERHREHAPLAAGVVRPECEPSFLQALPKLQHRDALRRLLLPHIEALLQHEHGGQQQCNTAAVTGGELGWATQSAARCACCCQLQRARGTHTSGAYSWQKILGLWAPLKRPVLTSVRTGLPSTVQRDWAAVRARTEFPRQAHMLSCDTLVVTKVGHRGTPACLHSLT